MLLLDQEGIIAPLCISHDCTIQGWGSINIPLQKRKFQDHIPCQKRKAHGNFKIIFHVKKGKLTILGLSNMPKSGGWMSVTTIDIGLNNDFDN